VTDDKHCVFGALEDTFIGVAVAPRRVVEAFAPRKRLVSFPSRLPLPVVVERQSLELADPDVVQARVDDQRWILRGEREPGRFLCAGELRDNAEVDSEPSDLGRERLGLPDT
jgi:hypothetical protein